MAASPETQRNSTMTLLNKCIIQQSSPNQRFLMPQCLESQDCHLIPLFYRNSALLLFCLVQLLRVAHSPVYFPESSLIFFIVIGLKKQKAWALLIALLFVQFRLVGDMICAACCLMVVVLLLAIKHLEREINVFWYSIPAYLSFMCNLYKRAISKRLFFNCVFVTTVYTCMYSLD